MKRGVPFWAIVAAFLAAAGPGAAEVPGGGAPAAAATPVLSFAAEPLEDVFTAAQPTLEHFAQAAAAGIKTVVNLRTSGEEGSLPQERAEVERLGMRYIEIPVGGAEDLTDEKVRLLAAVLDDPAQKPALVHCGSSNRVGALLALKEHRVSGRSAAEALELGKAAGLSSLEAAVRQMLGL